MKRQNKKTPGVLFALIIIIAATVISVVKITGRKRNDDIPKAVEVFSHSEKKEEKTDVKYNDSFYELFEQ